MKKFIIPFIALAGLVSCDSISGNGNIREESRTIGTIHSVKTSGSIDVEIKNGEGYSVTVEDDDNLLPYIVTEVEGGTLHIHYRNGYSIMNGHGRATVTVPALDGITTSGSGDITTDGVIKSTGRVEVNTSGSGNIHAQVEAPSVKVSGSGSADISLSGRTKDFICHVSGSGNIRCAGLRSENADIQISGSADAYVFASVSLKVSVSGSGDVHYSGNPASPEIHIAGSGTVQADK
jgi:hypothetical protein